MGVIYTRDKNDELKQVKTVRWINKTGEGLDTEIREFNQMNDIVTAYLEAADAAYTDDNGSSVTVINNGITAVVADEPNGYPLSIIVEGTLYVQNEGDGNGYSLPAANSDIRSSVYNAIPGKVHQYLVKDSSGTLMDNGRIKPTGKVRMIKFLGYHNNCRDLGGWDCDGGTVKYGKLFRSAVPASAETWIDNKIIKSLGIRHQIDFRSDAEASYITESPFGSDVRYHRIHIETYYADALSLNGVDAEDMKKIFRTIMDAAMHNEPLMYHCSLGRDRTGTVTLMILALLGVSKTDVDKDFELTSFSEIDGTISVAKRTSDNYVGVETYLETFNGSCFRNNVVKWFVNAGFTLDELNAFRAAMINGSPTALTEADLEDVIPDEPDTPDEPTNYTNLVPTATAEPYGTEIYNAPYGYCNGKYLSSSETLSYSNDSACVATGSIPVAVGYADFPTIYIKGITIDLAINGHCRCYFTKPDGTVQSSNLFDNTDKYTLTKLADLYYKLEPVMGDDGNAVMANYVGTGNISFRLSGIGTGENLIVTIDEPIE